MKCFAGEVTLAAAAAAVIVSSPVRTQMALST